MTEDSKDKWKNKIMKFYINKKDILLSNDNIMFNIEFENNSDINLWITEKELKDLERTVSTGLENILREKNEKTN